MLKITKRPTRLLNKTLFAAALSGLTLTVHAGNIVIKPGSQVYPSPEFGQNLARNSTYTAVAAMQETVVIPNEPIEHNRPSAMQGAVYLFNGTNTSPERIYQFPGNVNIDMRLGARVALSEKWLAVAAVQSDLNTPPSAVYIIGKTNGQWAQCPTLNGVLDCSTSVSANGVLPAKSIIKIPFADHLFWKDMNIAISDDYLVMADRRHSRLAIYRYNATGNNWVQEFYSDEPDDKFTGTAVAIEGNRVAVSSTYSDAGAAGAELGSVRIFTRNSATSTWSATASAYGYFSSGNFGHALKMHSGNLVVSAGAYGQQQHLAFYRFATDGSLTTPYILPVPANVDYMGLYGDNLAAYIQGPGTGRLEIYSRDTTSSNNTWKYQNYLNPNNYQNITTNGYGYTGNNEIDVNGDNVVLGYRGYAGLIGAFINEKISQIDGCKLTTPMVANCSFDNNSGANWQFLTYNGAAASVNYAGSQLKASIFNTGTEQWHIQARASVSLAKSTTYALEFRAKADGVRQIAVNLGRNGTPDNNWTSYGNVPVTLSTDWVTYQMQFSTPADAISSGYLDFNLGKNGTLGVSLDSVNLYPVTP